MDHVALHLRRLAQQNVHRHVDRLVTEFRVDQFELTLFGGHAHGGEQTAFAFAHGFEQWQAFRRDGENIAFLRLVAPDFLRRHARFFQRDLAQVENRAALGVVGDFRERVRQAARAHVVDRDDRIVCAHLPAGVDDFLGAAFHFRIAALDGIEVQVGRVAAGGHRRGGAAAHADTHARATKLHQQAADGDVVLVRVLRRDIADAARDHDRLVVAEHGIAVDADVLFIRAEVAAQYRTAEFIRERGAAQRAVDHDLQWRSDAFRFAVLVSLGARCQRRRHGSGRFPAAHGIRQRQVRDGETGQASFWLGAAARCAFVADLAARARGGAWEWGDGRRVVMRFHLHQGVRQFGRCRVFVAVTARVEAGNRRAFHDGRVVAVGDDSALRLQFVRVLDHAEQ